MKNIYVVRHCSAEGQHKDSPLTQDGLKQARSLSDFFTKQNVSIDKIISSPYLRAIESIKPYAEKSNVSIHIDNRLKERIVSEEPIDDWLEVLEHSFMDHSFRLHGGESGNDVMQRVNPILENIYTNDEIQNVIIVSHGNLIALLLHQFEEDFGFEKWKELRNPDVYKIQYHGNVQSVECIWEPLDSFS